MTTEDALLAAVLAAPDDDVVRLVYADWLEENGKSERAEFIRVQCELAMVPVKTFGPDEGKEELRHMNLKRRERDLWMPPSAARTAVIRDLPTGFSVAPESWLFFPPCAIIRRGFVSEVHCTLAEWCGGGECRTCSGRGHSLREDINGDYYTCPTCRGTGEGTAGTATTGIGPQIVRRHPVERVVLMGVEPREGVSKLWMWSWGVGERPHSLPVDIWNLLSDYANGSSITRFYHTREAALSALSAAIIAWAKSQPTHAVYHGDGQTYRIVQTGA